MFRFFRFNFIQILALALALLIPLSFQNNNTFFNILFIFCISFVSIYIGYSIHIKLKINNIFNYNFSSIIILGYSIVSLLSVILIFFLHIRPIYSFLIVFFVFLLFDIFKKRKNINVEEKYFQFTYSKFQFFDFFVLILITIFTIVWCRDLLFSLEASYQTGILNVWPDLFLHTNEIISLGNVNELNNQSLNLSGAKKNFYHIASYAIPALYFDVSNQIALQAAITFWTPFGIILMGLGVYLLSSILGNRALGLATVILVFLLPDSSMYGLKQDYFGFHWMLQISPGTGYAISIILLSVSMYIVGVRENKFNLVISSLFVVLISSFFRVQLALPACLMMGILADISWRPVKIWYRPVLYFLIFLLSSFSLLFFEKIELAPHFLSGTSGAEKFFDIIHNKIQLFLPTYTFLGQIYSLVYNNINLQLHWLITFFVFLISSIGLIFPLIILIGIINLVKEQHKVINFIPFLLFIVGFFVIIIVPIPPDGDFTNFGHRPFVLYYVTSIIFFIHWIYLIYKRNFIDNKFAKFLLLFALFVFVFIIIDTPIKYGKLIQQPKTWSTNLTSNQIPMGLYKSTSYIRDNSKKNDLILSSNLSPWATEASLTERPLFISREIFHMNFNGQLKNIYLNLKKQYDAFRFVKSPKDLCSLGKENKITWIIKFPSDFNDWPKDVLDMYVFKSDDFYVYNLDNKSCNKFFEGIINN